MNDEKFGELLSKKEAAAKLEISERTLQRLVSKRQIIFLYKKKYHGGKIAYFPISEVGRIKEAWEKKEPLPIVEIPSNEIQLAETKENSILDKGEGLDTGSNLSPSTEEAKTISKKETKNKKDVEPISAVEASAKLILTVQEVSVLTHIPGKELREELKKGKLRGLFRGHGWKVKRADLEDYVRSIYVPRRSDIIEESGTNEIDLGDFGELETWEG